MFKILRLENLFLSLFTVLSSTACVEADVQERQVAVATLADAVTDSVEYKEATEYQKLIIEGWTVMVSAQVQNDISLYQPIVEQLNKDLKRVKGVVPVVLLPELQKTVIWSEKSMPIQKLNSLFFNGSRKLTKKYALVPDSYGGIILGKTEAYLAVAGFKPWGMLHELTHAYHQFHIKHDYEP